MSAPMETWREARAKPRRPRSRSFPSNGSTRCSRRSSPARRDVEVIVIDNIVQEIATDVQYAGWTFGGTIPGKPIRAVQGDTINVTFQGRSDRQLALARLPLRPNAPGCELPLDRTRRGAAYSFTRQYPGAFMYHCGTPPVLMHIAAGMYGAMIVDPKEGWPPAQEICLVQSEFYLTDPVEGDAIRMPDYNQMMTQAHGLRDLQRSRQPVRGRADQGEDGRADSHLRR